MLHATRRRLIYLIYQLEFQRLQKLGINTPYMKKWQTGTPNQGPPGAAAA